MSFLKSFNKRKNRVRSRLKARNKSGLSKIAVFRSNKNFYAQLINAEGNVIKSSSSLQIKDSEIKNKKGVEVAKVVGDAFAKLCIEDGIKEVLFDKGGYLYAGRVKAFADSCREAGMKF